MRVAFIGAGPVGLEHLKAFRSLDVEVVGLCTKGEDSGRALAKQHGFPYYTNSVSELFEETRADAVVAALPIAEMMTVYPTLFAQPWASLVENRWASTCPKPRNSTPLLDRYLIVDSWVSIVGIINRRRWRRT